jgi:uncharacterized beta-barrel protein YwiB (DUF1934 family)
MPYKDAIVSIIGLQISGNAEPDLMELVTEGKFRLQGDDCSISYQESETTGMEGTTTTIDATGGIVTLTRIGAVNSQFIFQRGKRHLSHYDTQNGAFTVAVVASAVDIDIGEQGGNIHLGYEVDFNESERIYNDLMVEIKLSPRRRRNAAYRNRRP